jgi:hypothetical protein
MISWLERTFQRRALSHHAHQRGDFLLGLTMVVSPWIFAFSDMVDVRNAWLLLGFSYVIYSFLTDYYDLGGIHIFSFSIHRAFDFMVAGMLIVVDSLLLRAHNPTAGHIIVHYLFAIGIIVMAIFSKHRPVDERISAEQPHKKYAV